MSDLTSWGGQLVAAGHIQLSNGDLHAAAWTSSNGPWQQALDDSAPSSIALFPFAQRDSVVDLSNHVLALGTRIAGVGFGDDCQGGAGTTCPPDPVATWTSLDGLDWRAEPAVAAFDDATLRATASDGATVIVVGDAGFSAPRLWISDDGLAWQNETLSTGEFDYAHLMDVAHVSDGWIVGGYTARNPSDSSPGVPVAWFSPDGRHWSRAPVTGPPNEVAHGSVADFLVLPGFVAAGDYSSTDGGRSWAVARNLPMGDATTVSDGERAISASSYSTGSSLTSVGDGAGHPMYFFTSSDGLGWQPLQSLGDVADMPTADLYPVLQVFVLPTGIAAASEDGRLWRADAIVDTALGS